MVTSLPQRPDHLISFILNPIKSKHMSSKLFDATLRKLQGTDNNDTSKTLPVIGNDLLANYEHHWHELHQRSTALANNHKRVHQEINSSVSDYWLKQQAEWLKLKAELDQIPSIQSQLLSLTQSLTNVTHNIHCLESAYSVIVEKREQDLTIEWQNRKAVQLQLQKANHDKTEAETQAKITAQLNKGNKSTSSPSNPAGSSAEKPLAGLTSALEAQVKNFMSLNIKKFVMKKSVPAPSAVENNAATSNSDNNNDNNNNNINAPPPTVGSTQYSINPEANTSTASPSTELPSTTTEIPQEIAENTEEKHQIAEVSAQQCISPTITQQSQGEGAQTTAEAEATPVLADNQSADSASNPTANNTNNAANKSSGKKKKNKK
jgi:hypothetical protein